MYFYGFLLRKILEILQYFQYIKIYEAMKSVGIALFYSICVFAAIITMRLLILEILCGDESLISIFHFLLSHSPRLLLSLSTILFIKKDFIIQPTLH